MYKRQVVGRTHIARALFESGYGEDLEDAFKTYLEPGGAGYLPRLKIASERAIRLTKEAGGKAVLAHPKLTEYGDFDELLQKLKNQEMCIRDRCPGECDTAGTHGETSPSCF